VVLQIDAGHLGQFFRDIFTALAPGVECFGEPSLEEAELQRDIGRVEAFRDLVLPGASLC
jgi:hypothetical protein